MFESALASIKGATSSVATWALSRVQGAGVWLKHNSPHIGVPSHYPWNWWQKDMSYMSPEYERFGPVYTCVAILSQDISRLGMRHVRINDDGSREVVTTKAPSRVLRQPNDYQTRSDFFLYLMRSLLLDGNAYAIARRNERYEVESLWPINPRACYPYIESTTGEIYYQLGGDVTSQLADVNEGEWYPARDVLHIRLQTPRHPLMGESPLVATTYAVAAGVEINRHNASFFSNMSRPSGILRHPGRINEEGLRRLKDRWKELTTGGNTGEPAVLSEGMDWRSITMDAVASELVRSYELTERQVAQVFRVPSFLLSDLDKATISNVEGLMRFYINSGLGWYVDHLEESLTRFFRLPPNEHIYFDLESVLLRGDLKERLEALGKGVQQGIYSPNEARAKENLPPVEDGDEVRMQQQMVPLSYGTNLEAPGETSSEPDPSPVDETDEPTDEEVEEMSYQYMRTMFDREAA